MKRNLYLNIKDKETARREYLDAFAETGPRPEKIPVTDSPGRMTAEAVYAVCSSPAYNSCAMDGIAVISSHTRGASEEHPLLLREGTDYVEADTGDLLPPPYDAVIMAEDLIETEDGMGYRILAPAHPLAHVRPAGEDIVAGEMILPSGHVIRGVDISALLAGGVREISVVKKPLVAVIPTGDEMTDCYSEEGRDALRIPDGRIPETNSWMFASLIRENGGEARRWPIIPDNRELLKQAVKEAAEQCDIVIVNAGSSAGRDDYTVHVIRELGTVLTHGVAVKPGKPVILGKVGGRPVIGLPGYPVSAYLTFREFVVPVMDLFLGKKETSGETEPAARLSSGGRPGEVKAKLTRTLVSGLKYEEYVRVKLGLVEGRLIAAPLERGAGASMSLVRADGFCVIPRSSEGAAAGEEVKVSLLRPLDQIRKTLVVIGSHDIILDVINDMMLERQSGMCLSSTHVGSLSGLIALRKREAHLAPSHLLCEEDGSYNTAAVKEMFPAGEAAVIKGVRRRQGFLVKKGNPKGIRSITDITPEIRYINRQRGAGTRVLFDYLLKKNGMNPAEITGYDNEAATHMSVAVAVQKDNADTGMGIYSCAKVLGLDFVDVSFEEYDFVTWKSDLELPAVQEFLAVIRSREFRARLEQLGGYTCEETGEVRIV